MKITKEWLTKKGACAEGVAWLLGQEERDFVKVLKKLIRTGEREKLEWANWTIVRGMEYKQYVAYGIFAAEQVLELFEKKYPEDKRPRVAIEAVKKCLSDPSEKNKAAAGAAARAAWTAGTAGAAAWTAGAAARAAWTAAWAAGAAARAVARDAMKIKILKHGITLLKEKK